MVFRVLLISEEPAVPPDASGDSPEILSGPDLYGQNFWVKDVDTGSFFGTMFIHNNQDVFKTKQKEKVNLAGLMDTILRLTSSEQTSR